MFAEKHGHPQEYSFLREFSPPASLRIQLSPDSKPSPQLLKYSPESHIFLQPPFCQGMHSIFLVNGYMFAYFIVANN